MLLHICNIVDVSGIDRDIIISALNKNEFTDFEDCVQSECAADFGADYIINRNVKDFAKSAVPAVLPEEFLKQFNA